MEPIKKDGDVWDDARLVEALERLNHLHVKARLLRETIPKILEPLIQKGTTPKEMFDSFKEASTGAQADIKEFARLMREDDSKAVFEYAQKSQGDDPSQMNSWKHKDNPQWFSGNGNKV